jgi:hypothetical protein
VGGRVGVAKVAEYRAIFGGAGADLRLLGAPDENRFTMSRTGEMGVRLSPCFKKEIPVIDCLRSDLPARR